jgi:hypothetical protein
MSSIPTDVAYVVHGFETQRTWFLGELDDI